MFEIFIPFYMAISCLIAWMVFSPFAFLDGTQSRKFAKIKTCDLLAVFLPLSGTLSLLTKPSGGISVWFVLLVVSTALILSGFSLLAGLYLFEKMAAISAAKRIAVIGIIIPFGSSLTLAWVALPIYAFALSVHLAVPSLIAVAVMTTLLRIVSIWVCRLEMA